MSTASLATAAAPAASATNLSDHQLHVFDIDGTTIDRTGKQADYQAWLPTFNQLHARPAIHLTYATGRDHDGIMDVQKSGVTLPEFAVAMVGSQIFERAGGDLHENRDWIDHVLANTPDWEAGLPKIREYLAAQEDLGITMQGQRWQNRFKSSWYIDATPEMLAKLGTGAAVAEEVTRKVEEVLRTITATPFRLVDSWDDHQNRGLLDVLPACTTKRGGVEFVRDKLVRVGKDRTIAAGDTGNDLDVLTNGYYAIVVGNAHPDFKARAERVLGETPGMAGRYYIADQREGTIVAILSGLDRFGFYPEDLRPSPRG